MKMSLTGGALALILLVVVIVGYGTFFTVDQTSQALVVRLGKPVRVITEPGLNLKVPFIDSVIYIDKRILAIESPAQEVILASQDRSNANPVVPTAESNIGAQAGERLVVDAFARYRITDPLKFYQTVGPAGGNPQLSILLNSTLRRVLGGATLTDVVRNKREELMAQMREQLDGAAHEFGIDVVDVRIRRADLPEPNSQAVYQRMQTERQREAAQFRAEGSQKAQAIRAKADRDVTVIVADANSQAETIRGQGDGESNGIFAQAYGQDPGFFAFYRSMQAYEKSIQHSDTNLVLGPNADFFRYFGDPSGRTPVEAGGAVPSAAPPATHAGASKPAVGGQDSRAAATK
jgi:modulator of FtsH protease HflC